MNYEFKEILIIMVSGNYYFTENVEIINHQIKYAIDNGEKFIKIIQGNRRIQINIDHIVSIECDVEVIE